MRPFTLNIRGTLREYTQPTVMGILNATPDSFYAQSRVCDTDAVRRRTEQMLVEGADFIDVGACSTRPGAVEVSVDEELRRLAPVIAAVRSVSADVPVSVDTYRASVAVKAIREMGADIVNDISGGADPDMWPAIASLKVPYILMHMRGTPQTMHQHTHYDDVLSEVLRDLAEKIQALHLMGVNDIVIDPGFGSFSKSLEQNYMLLSHMRVFKTLAVPLLAGVSRKSMVTRLLDIDPGDALNGTTVINTIALSKGAAILRVHDVGSAVQAVKIHDLSLPQTGRIETV